MNNKEALRRVFCDWDVASDVILGRRGRGCGRS